MSGMELRQVAFPQYKYHFAKKKKKFYARIEYT